jgi:hypothetical protein
VAHREVDEERAGEGEENTGDDERDGAVRAEPAQAPGLVGDVLLEAREARVHRCALVFDVLPEVRESLAAAVEHAVDDVRDVALPRAELAIIAGRDLEVGDRLVTKASPDRALGRRRNRRVDAAPYEVEERRRELVRTASPPWRRSVGTRAGSVSVGGSCSYSRS